MNQFGLSEFIVRAVLEKGYKEATPVQMAAIPVALQGLDALVSAQTGTGKTASFVLPMLHRLLQDKSKKRGPRTVRALILTPTRELAAQVGESVRTYGKYLPLRSSIVYGGVSIGPQMKSLRNGVDVLIATPGRLLDHVNQRTVDLSQVEMFVLDEADRMLDMGFINDIKKVLSILPEKRQGLLFSATFSDGIKRLTDSFLKSPKIIEVERKKVEPISQLVHLVDNRRKKELLTHLIQNNKMEQILIFTRTKHGADKLSEQLEMDGIKSTAIHGNKTQGARMRALSDFKKGYVKVLVATDVAARGLDIDLLPYVVNFELPQVPEDYVHRIGRTGRAGNVGAAISLVCVDELQLLRNIERLLKAPIAKETIAGFEPDLSIRPQPIRRGGRFSSSRGGGFRGNSGGGGDFRGNSRGPSGGDRSRNRFQKRSRNSL